MFDSIDGIQGTLEVEIDALYSDNEKNLEEKESLVDENLEEIKALKIGEEIELFAF